MKPYQAYQKNAVNTASGGELTLMLYNGAIKFTRQAIKDIEQKNFEQKNKHIQRAQNIIQELMLTLNPRVEISQQMLPLYEYIYHQLMEGNINNDTDCLNEALTYITEFRDVWKEVLQRTRKQHFKQGVQI